MQAFTVMEGLVAPLDRANVDTDAIIPKQYLKSIKRSGFGPFLFDDWRYLDAGDLDIDPATRRINPDFVLNQPRYRGASILLNDKPVATFGELTTAELQSRKLRQPCVVATVEAQTLLATPLRQPSLRELSRFQAVERDFSFVFPDSVQ